MAEVATLNLATRAFRDRISWGAITAGVVIALAIQAMLGLLGLGLGFGAVDPYAASPFEGLGIGAIVYLALTLIISLFVGGLVAGRLAGINDRADGALNGVLVWSILVILFLFTASAVFSFALRSATTIASTGISAASGAAGSVDQQAVAEALLPEEQPADPAAQQPAQPPPAQQGEAGLSQEEAADILAQSTGLDRDQAQQIIARLQQEAGEIDLGSAAQSVGQQVLSVSSTVAWAAFIVWLVLLGFSALGGFVGAPKRAHMVTAV